MTIKSAKSKLSAKYNKAIKNRDVLRELHKDMLSSLPSLSQLQEKRGALQNITSISHPEELDKIVTWFAKLRLLYGVPFEYLVFNEELLPIESIKFFYLDNNWISALVDGAYSIGRTTESDKAHDEVFAPQADIYSTLATVGLRNNAFSKPADDHVAQVITGFLMRSSIIKNWPGIEIRGYDNDVPKENKLSILRMELLSPDIMLCLFAGEVNSLKFYTPPEDLHFGVLSNTQGDYKQINNSTQDEVYLNYYNSNKKIVNIKQLANDIATKVSPGTTLTPGEFGLQMIAPTMIPVLSYKQTTSTPTPK